MAFLLVEHLENARHLLLGASERDREQVVRAEAGPAVNLGVEALVGVDVSDVDQLARTGRMAGQAAVGGEADRLTLVHPDGDEAGEFLGFEVQQEDGGSFGLHDAGRFLGDQREQAVEGSLTVDPGADVQQRREAVLLPHKPFQPLGNGQGIGRSRTHQGESYHGKQRRGPEAALLWLDRCLDRVFEEAANRFAQLLGSIEGTGPEFFFELRDSLGAHLRQEVDRVQALADLRYLETVPTPARGSILATCLIGLPLFEQPDPIRVKRSLDFHWSHVLSAERVPHRCESLSAPY